MTPKARKAWGLANLMVNPEVTVAGHPWFEKVYALVCQTDWKIRQAAAPPGSRRLRHIGAAMSAPVYTLADWHRRRVWRQRGLIAGGILVALTLPALLAYVVLGSLVP